MKYFTATVGLLFVQTQLCVAANTITQEESTNSDAQKTIREIVVESSLVQRNYSEISNPVHIISGAALENVGTQSLGELLDSKLGVASSDYGPAVGQPVIRGLSGPRVRILDNGLVIRDVSNLGADHVNDVDLNDVEQIEVVRGPSALLFNNGAIGGIINVVDGIIAEEDITTSEFQVGAESQSVNDGSAYNFSYKANLGGLNVKLAHKTSDFGDYDIPIGALAHADEHHDDGEEPHEDEEEHHDDEATTLANSDYELTKSKLGISRVGDWGFVGVSYSESEVIMGVPFHAEPADAHPEEGSVHEDHEGERIFAFTDSSKFDVKGAINLDGNWIKKVGAHVRVTDYMHSEQHAEDADHDAADAPSDGHPEHEEGPTVFSTEATEISLNFDLAGAQSHNIMLNFADQEASITGHEAFMNPSSTQEYTIGYFRTQKIGGLDISLGLRHDRVSRDGSVTHHDEDHADEDHADEDHADEDHADEELEIDIYNITQSYTSLALSASRDITEALNLKVGMARISRGPADVELFINGPHLSTGRFEVGNPNLDTEQATNIDLAARYETDQFFAEITFFSNDVDNYIYLQDETEEEHAAHTAGESDPHMGLTLAEYLQKDATFTGYEIELGKSFQFWNGDLMMSVARDSVKAEFNDKTHVPRIVPSRNIATVAYNEDDFNVRLLLKDVEQQTNIGAGEQATDGYTMLDIDMNKTFSVGAKTAFNVSLFANNLLDESARNHSSFVKDNVPLPGRNLGIKLSATF